ncbi:ESPR-type extended signal peptide-containing protein, partial [Burkholderia sp. AW49-1]
MNRSFKSIWNEALRAWVAISENSASRGKPNQLKLVVSLTAGMIALSATGEVAHANSAVVDRAVATGLHGAVFENEAETTTKDSPDVGSADFSMASGYKFNGGDVDASASDNEEGAGPRSTQIPTGAAVSTVAQTPTYQASAFGLRSISAQSGAIAIDERVVKGEEPAALDSYEAAMGARGLLNNAANTYVVANSGMYVKDESAQAGNGATAVGASANANGMSAVAIGGAAVATAQNSTALGALSAATNVEATAVGLGASAAGYTSTALGKGAKAEAANSVAIGAYSTADREWSVSVGAAGNRRQITNVASGTEGTDAVNVDQLRATAQSVAAALGGGAKVKTDGTLGVPTYKVGGTDVHSVGAA